MPLILLQQSGQELQGIASVIKEIGGLPVIVGVVLLLGAFPLLAEAVQAWASSKQQAASAAERRDLLESYTASLTEHATTSREHAGALKQLAETMQAGQLQRAEEGGKTLATLDKIASRVEDVHVGVVAIHGRLDEAGK